MLVHQDAEIVDADLCAKLREALRDPEVGLIGCVGALDVRSIAWWEGSVTLASFINRYEEHGGGDLASFSWSWEEAPPWAQTGEVETLDGFVLVLLAVGGAQHPLRRVAQPASTATTSTTACRCARPAARSSPPTSAPSTTARSRCSPTPRSGSRPTSRVAEKWDGRMPRVGTAPGDWRERALRAEAERDVADALAHTKVVELEARARELRRGIAETRGSLSWRLSAPLRRLGAAR